MTARRLINAAGLAGRAGSRARGAFTLVEMLVSVAAIGIIALGLSRLFASTSETVRIGKRVSAMNEYAGMLERTMRADIQAMSRNAPLVIRHREIGGSATNQGVLLHQDEREGYSRTRRIDQMVFFVERPTASMRMPMADDRFPVGAAARVYYRHGLKRELFSGGTPDSAALSPTLDDTNAAASNVSFGAVGPNEFASDWILLRHLTALVPPQAGETPSTVPAALNSVWPDSLVQVRLLPATPSLFRNEVANSVTENLENGAPWARAGDLRVVPNVASGLVDVAAMDLAAVRSRIMQGVNPFDTSLTPEAMGQYFPLGTSSGGSVNPTIEDSVPTYTKKWMAMLLPGGEYPIGSGPTSFDLATTSGTAPEHRIRAELAPPDFTGNRNSARFPDAEAFKRADQLMLSASNFVPGCTEFIVEWSFGRRFPDADINGRAGELIWHGLPRYRFPDGDRTNFQDANRLADVYRGETTNTSAHAEDVVYQGYQLYDSSGDQIVSVGRAVLSDLIHYPLGSDAMMNRPWPQGLALYSIFGLLDPSYRRPPITAPPNSAIFPGGYTGLDPTAPATLPWAWPTLLRVTISLVDPADPSVEQTYEFIFDVPQSDSSAF